MTTPKYQPLTPGDFIVVQTRRYEWPLGYVAEFRIGRVTSVDKNGKAEVYRDATGLSRMIGAETVRQTYGVPSRLFALPDAFWDSMKMAPGYYDSYEEVKAFIQKFVKALSPAP